MSDMVMILAVLVAPIVAVQVNVFLERSRERRQRRLHLFRTLMTTRASNLSFSHVEALNMIDIEFQGGDKKTRAVLSAWKAYLDHLNQTSISADVWAAKREDLFVDLLHTMAVSLDYDYDKTHIRRTSYFPRGLGDLERDQAVIRKGLVAVFEGKQWLPVVAAPWQAPEQKGTPELAPRSEELTDVRQLARPAEPEGVTRNGEGPAEPSS